MELFIFKIALIILTIRIIYLIVKHLIIVFWDKATKDTVSEILKDPEYYVRVDHMCKFMYDMVWLYIFIRLIVGVFSGKLSLT